VVTPAAARRGAALYLATTALAVALLLMLTPVFHDGSPDYPAWQVLNWFMAAGVALIAFAAFRSYRAFGDGERVSVGYLRSRLASYGAVVLAMLFFWGWLWTLNPESETGAAVTSHLVYFPVMDAVYVVLALSTARGLWRGRADSGA